MSSRVYMQFNIMIFCYCTMFFTKTLFLILLTNCNIPQYFNTRLSSLIAIWENRFNFLKLTKDLPQYGRYRVITTMWYIIIIISTQISFNLFNINYILAFIYYTVMIIIIKIIVCHFHIYFVESFSIFVKSVLSLPLQ